MADAEDLIDYEEEEEIVQQPAAQAGAQANAQKKAAGGVANGVKDAGAGGAGGKEIKKGSYVGIHSTGFRDFLLKPELLRAIVDCGFEHPSEGIYF